MQTLEVPSRFNRSAASLRDPARAAASASFLIRYACDTLGLSDLGGKEVLDVGCGTKFTQAFLNNDLPIGRYVGIDVYAEMIEFLQTNVADPRFDHRHLDVRNELYNPDAPPMTEHTDLGVGDRRFDVIWLFSVFTHLNPDDYRVMLKLLRRHVRPGGRLLYTLFVDEFTEGGFGHTDKMDRALREREAEQGGDSGPTTGQRTVEPFRDVFPDQPLRCALYSREHAFELIEGTGWSPLELLPPNEYAQHLFVCAPS